MSYVLKQQAIQLHGQLAKEHIFWLLGKHGKNRLLKLARGRGKLHTFVTTWDLLMNMKNYPCSHELWNGVHIPCMDLNLILNALDWEKLNLRKQCIYYTELQWGQKIMETLNLKLGFHCIHIPWVFSLILRPEIVTLCR